MKYKFNNKQAIITGGSAGIGLSIAKKLASLGCQIHLIARDKEKLTKAKFNINETYPNVNIEIYSVDLKNKELLEETMISIGKNHGIDILVNNAGVEAYGKFEDIEETALRHVFEVNYWAAVNATRAAIPYLKSSSCGHVSFVSSVAGYLGAFGYVSYAPTKFAVTGFAECLRMEMRPHNIGVSIVFPPDTDTDMYTREKQNQIPEAKALSKHGKVISPDLVANKLIKSIEKSQFEVLCNKESILVKKFKNLFPSLYYKTLDRIIDSSL